MKDESIERKAARAEKLLLVSLPSAVCIAQEWDERIDCFVRMPDGSLVGEMIPIAELTNARVLATGERLKKRFNGSLEPLLNEISSPTKITCAPNA